MRRWLTRAGLWTMCMASGGGLFVLQGCDPTVRDTVLAGVEGASTTLFTTLIQAFFQSLAAEEDNNVTVVMNAPEEVSFVVA